MLSTKDPGGDQLNSKPGVPDTQKVQTSRKKRTVGAYLDDEIAKEYFPL